MRGLDLPVGPEKHPGAKIALIAEAPGEDESRFGRPLVGKSGMEEMRALEAIGLRRGDFHWTNALQCRPPKNRLERALARVRAKNKVVRDENERTTEVNRERRKQGLDKLPLKDLVPTPLDCCRPRLMRELHEAGVENIIALGKASLQGIDTSHRRGILAVRGMPVHMTWATAKDLNGNSYPSLFRPLEKDPAAWTHEERGGHVKVLPTVRPAFVLRAGRWRQAFHNDHQRALKLFDDSWEWQAPKMEFNPSLERIRDYLGLTWVGHRPELVGTPGYAGGWLATGTAPRAFDYETDLLETLDCVVRCIQIGTPKEVIVIAFKSVEGATLPYTIGEHDVLKDMLRAWFTGKSLKVGHNCLHTGTPVRLADGTSVPIEKLVRDKFDGEVLGLNEAGEVVPAKVKGWSRHRVEKQEWLVLRREGEKKHARGLTLTPDHQVYTQRGRIRCDKVVPGDFLLGPELQLEPHEEQALLGTLLGDSSCTAHTSRATSRGKSKALIKRVADYPKATLTGSHTDPDLVAQKIRWMNGVLASVKPQKPTLLNAEGKRPHPYRTSQMRQVATLARRVYGPHGKRRFRPELLEALSPVAWAWLFADDGGKHKRGADRQGDKEPVLLAICGFPKRDRDDARQWFTKRFGYTALTKGGSLRLGVEATEKFCRMIAPYLLPAARYKLPGGYGPWPEFVGFPKKKPRKPLAVRVESVTPYVPPRGTTHQRTKADTRWCLTTETGNFLTGFGFVKNSNYYDALVTEVFLGVVILNHADNIMAHRLIAGELPHSLAFLGSVYSMIHDWKAGDPGVNARTDLELWMYGCYDSSVTAEIAVPVYTEVEAKGLGGFASEGCESRLLKEVKAADGRPRQGSNWKWSSDAQGIPILEVTRDEGEKVRFLPGIATPGCAADVKALTENGCPVLHEGLTGLLALDHSIQDAGRDMHVIGMLPNQQMRVNFFTEHAAKMEATRGRIQEIAHKVSGTDKWGGTKRKPKPFNPASPVQVRKLLSETWGLKWDDVTEKTGTLSVGDGAVRKMLARPIPDDVRAFLLDLRGFRKAHKIVTTYLVPLGLRNPLDGKQRPSQRWGRAWAGNDGIIEDVQRAEAYNWADLDDDEAVLEDLDLATLQASFHAPPGKSKLRWNGRVHADWKAHRAVTGRISSSPNLQNIIRWLRAMFVPSSLEWLKHIRTEMLQHPGEFNAWAARHVDLRHWTPREGHTFVYADADQIELRIAASRWGAARYLEAFDKGWDPHQITMHAIWGDRIWSMQGAPSRDKRYFKAFEDGSEFDKARDLGKGVLYASVYGAKAPTVHDMITSAEDRKGNLIYRDLTLREVRTMQANLLKNCPEFPSGWQREIHTLKTIGYIQEPVTGRRFDCLDGSDDLSLIVNRPIQASGAGIIALATAEMRAKYPAGFGGPFTGLVNHCHDAMTWEVPISMAPQLQADLTDAMCRTIPAFPNVKFIGEAIQTPKWK